MPITIDLDKIGKFAYRHKEAIAVACVAIILTRKQTHGFKSMSNFIDSKGLDHEYWHFSQK